MDIKEIINQRYAMPDASLDRLRQCLTEVSYPKGFRVLESGKIEKDIFFIKKATILEYFNNLEHFRRVSGAEIYDMPDGKKVCSKSEFVLENCGKMPNIAN